MRFRLIEANPEPAERFGYDEVAMRYADQRGVGVIVLYRMRRSAISISRLQAYSDVLLTEWDGRTFDVIRRPSSGSSVVHNDAEGDFSYTVALPLRKMPKTPSGIPDSQAFRIKYSCVPLREALDSLGIETDILGHNNIIVRREGRKISSNAYAGNKDFHKAGMVHGYVACNEGGRVLWDRLLGGGGDKVAFASEFGVSPGEVYKAVRDAFLDLGYSKKSGFTGEESRNMEQLVREVYGSEEWTLNAKDPRGLWSVRRTKSFPPCPELRPRYSQDTAQENQA